MTLLHAGAAPLRQTVMFHNYFVITVTAEATELCKRSDVESYFAANEPRRGLVGVIGRAREVGSSPTRAVPGP